MFPVYLCSSCGVITPRAGESSTYEFSIDFYKEIIPEVFWQSHLSPRNLISLQESRKHLTSRSLVLNIRKKDAELEYWPRLTKDKIKNSYIKTDFSKWVDEDEQESTTSFDDDTGMGDMGGMGGMPGMGGMGGMGGMPGMGGMGGMPGMGGFGGEGGMGGIDLEKVCTYLPCPFSS